VFIALGFPLTHSVMYLRQVYTTLKAQGQVALPLGPTFPPVDLLTRLLTPSNAAKEPKGVRQAAAAVADALLEGVLRASEGGGGVDPQTLRRQPAAVRRVMRTSPALPPALALHVLAAADANLCVPAAHPLRYLRTLQPYLQLSSSGRDAAVAADDAQQLQCMLAVVDSVLSLLTDVRVPHTPQLDPLTGFERSETKPSVLGERRELTELP